MNTITEKKIKEAKITVGIRCLNEALYLPSLLDDLSQQTFSDYEVVFLDSGSTDGTLDVIIKSGYPAFSIGAEDFNFGKTCDFILEKSQSDFVIFFSAHVNISDKNLLHSCYNYMVNSKHIDAAFFRQVVNRKTGASIPERAYLNWKFNGIKRKVLKINCLSDAFFSNAGSIIRKSSWKNLRFGDYNGSEDRIWAFRIAQSGGKVAYLGDLEIEHSHDESPLEYEKRVRLNKNIQNEFSQKGYSLPVVLGLIFGFVRNVFYGRTLNLVMAFKYALAYTRGLNK